MKLLFAGLYPQSYLKRIISRFREMELSNWRFVYVTTIREEKQYHLCERWQPK